MEISDRLTVYLVGTMENQKPRLDVKKKKKEEISEYFRWAECRMGDGSKGVIYNNSYC